MRFRIPPVLAILLVTLWPLAFSNFGTRSSMIARVAKVLNTFTSAAIAAPPCAANAKTSALLQLIVATVKRFLFDMTVLP